MPFNKDDLEYGGYCDRQDGSRGWACSLCFSQKYHPRLEWNIPNWAVKLVQQRRPERCLEQSRGTLLRIATFNPFVGFYDPKEEANYLRAELKCRTEAVSVAGSIPSDPYLAGLLRARIERQVAYRGLHEHERRESRHYPWIALSRGRGIRYLEAGHPKASDY